MLLFFEYLFVWFVFYSFAGWVYESILVSCRERRWVNRGFLNGPLCPIYGTGAVAGVVVLGGVRNPVVLFVLSMVGASILEYFTSWAMEQLFHARWWDYSHFRFNLNGRICLLGAVVFGIAGVIIVDVIQPVVEQMTMMVPLRIIHMMCAVLLVLIIIDTIVTVCGIVDFEQSLERFKVVASRYGDAMREKVTDAVSGAAEMANGVVGDAAGIASNVISGASDKFGGMPSAVSQKVGDSWQNGKDMSAELMLRIKDAADSVFNRQQRRMIASFPRLKTTRNNETLQQLRETLERLYRRGR
ncbi:MULTISPECIES: putative ABC transporter permease [unclassified Bifidobacterium]|uniref:putative ABC transporter permease n=1 Tax=unclassified Bifidobacterium TaxID=2608897 RepID=UPI00112B110A|nr:MULTISPECIES: putative ABC transporter permease [unclassified Bifidobacterium]TPF79100.1 membrane protein [Bifidobacterium sp. UTCIF-1]TPF80971.1 membrane protein [Bifidobacterium sp. UTCIF-24]TPF83232.1 membrane protein [Bifidobacterium sp. UTCIF-3]TPF85007.1 membrane protein [Bifidobacterium sp. UTCIF-36]TPF88962.1 membrane protein [Bifidobacterium sp. UTBIF-56]